jgi:hypothetical protein
MLPSPDARTLELFKFQTEGKFPWSISRRNKSFLGRHGLGLGDRRDVEQPWRLMRDAVLAASLDNHDLQSG